MTVGTAVGAAVGATGAVVVEGVVGWQAARRIGLMIKARRASLDFIFSLINIYLVTALPVAVVSIFSPTTLAKA